MAERPPTDPRVTPERRRTNPERPPGASKSLGRFYYSTYFLNDDNMNTAKCLYVQLFFVRTKEFLYVQKEIVRTKKKVRTKKL